MAPRLPPIIALGGGGFSMEPGNPLLDEFVLERTGRDAPRVCFIPTASGDSEEYVTNFHAAFGRLGARTSHVLLPWDAMPDGEPEDGTPCGSPTPADPLAHLGEQDAVYVGGGNTRRMLAVWRAYGVIPALRDLWTGGRALIAGVSAGGLCWFENGVTDSVPGRLTSMAAMGWLPGSFCPHYDGELERRPAFERMVRAGDLPPGFGVDDGCALVFEGTTRTSVVSSRPDARAWWVDLEGGDITCTCLETEYLGAGR